MHSSQDASDIVVDREAYQVVDLNTNATELSPPPPLREAAGKDTALFLIECADGFRCAVLHCMGEGSIVGSWAYAGKVDGEVLACGCECAPLLPSRSD